MHLIQILKYEITFHDCLICFFPTDPFVLVVYGEKDWDGAMEESVQTNVLNLLHNNDIPFITCSPRSHWCAQPEQLVNQEEVRRDRNAFRERVVRKVKNLNDLLLLIGISTTKKCRISELLQSLISSNGSLSRFLMRKTSKN